MVWAKLKEWSVTNIKPIIQSMAEAAGHCILWMLPYHSNLQPIKLVWADVKGKVGQQYTDKTTFAQVKQRLNQAFLHVTSKQVTGCINKATQELLTLYKSVRQEDNDDINDNNSDNADVAYAPGKNYAPNNNHASNSNETNESAEISDLD